MLIAAPKLRPTAAENFDAQRWIKATNLYWQEVVTRLVIALNQVRTDPLTPKAEISAPTPADVKAGVVAKYQDLN